MGRVFALGVTLLALCLLASLTPSSDGSTDATEFMRPAFARALPAEPVMHSAATLVHEASTPADAQGSRTGRARQMQQRSRSAFSREVEAKLDARSTTPMQQTLPHAPASAPSLAPAQPPEKAEPIVTASIASDAVDNRQRYAALPVPRIVVNARQELDASRANATRTPVAPAVASAPTPKRRATSEASRHSIALEPTAAAGMSPATALVRITPSSQTVHVKPASSPTGISGKVAAQQAPKAKRVPPKPQAAEVAQRPIPRRIAHAAPSFLGVVPKRASAGTSQFVPTSTSASSFRARGPWQRMTFEGQ